MASKTPLQGSELIDCVKANGEQAIEVVAERCGYGSDIAAFEKELQKAGEHIGVEINSFQDFVAPKEEKEKGVIIAPDSPSEL
jgi:hypothetical protein